MAGKKLTPEEKVTVLKERLAKAQAALSKKRRTERNGELVAVGIAVEHGYQTLSEAFRAELAALADGLDARNKQRFGAALARFAGQPDRVVK